jgi:hypothetical protein
MTSSWAMEIQELPTTPGQFPICMILDFQLFVYNLLGHDYDISSVLERAYDANFSLNASNYM